MSSLYRFPHRRADLRFPLAVPATTPAASPTFPPGRTGPPSYVQKCWTSRVAPSVPLGIFPSSRTLEVACQPRWKASATKRAGAGEAREPFRRLLSIICRWRMPCNCLTVTVAVSQPRRGQSLEEAGCSRYNREMTRAEKPLTPYDSYKFSLQSDVDDLCLEKTAAVSIPMLQCSRRFAIRLYEQPSTARRR